MEPLDIMINFQVFGLAHLMQMLALEEKTLRDRRSNLEMLPPGSLPAPIGQYRVEETEAKRLSGLLQFALHNCQRLEIGAGVDRAERFLNKLGRPMLFIDLEPEMRVLKETIEDGLRYIGFYHYPNAKMGILNRVEADWQSAIAKFPSAKADAIEAVDCYALGHYTACVYHLMRLLEHGLREMAHAVNLTFDVQQWQTIIEQIESRIRDTGDHWPKSAAKSDWMKFYSEAAKEFFYFKDGWRNYASHGGGPYDEHQALSVLEHVRTFMNHLSTRLSEAP
jgi:hypothetical protein